MGSNKIVSMRELSVKSIEFGVVRVNDHGSKNVYVKYGGQRMYVKMGKLPVPFGVGTAKEDASKFNVQFGLPKGNVNSEIIKRKGEELDEYIINAAYENQDNWFTNKSGKKMSREVIASKYHPFVKPSSKEMYPPNIRAQLPTVNRDGELTYSTEFYDENNNIKEGVNMENIREVIPAQSQCSSLWTASSVWVSSTGFGISWKLVQVKVYKPEGLNLQGKCLITDEEEEEEEYEEETKSVEETQSVEEESDEAITETVPEPEVKVVKKKVVGKK